MDYLLKASGIVVILFLFYQLFLKNETFFKSIRVYFIAGLLIVLIIPLIEIPIYIDAITTQINSYNYEGIITNSITKQGFDWSQIIVFGYLIGVVFFGSKFLIQLISLVRLFLKHKPLKQGNYYFVETTKKSSPFSFFNIITYNKSQFSIDELKHIINHEKAHAQQWHSIDTLLAHLLVITLWFNPFVWLYKKAVQQNLEFLADAYALKLTNNYKQYQFTLLKTCSSNYCAEITNNFYNSLLKKRIIMLQKNKSKNKNQWKYLLLLPILIAFLFTFNTTAIAQKKGLTEIEEINNLKVELIIGKNSTNENLKKETAFFKKQFDINITFKGIKRNKNNEITAIKIDAKGKDLRSQFENFGTNPIKPIKITYISDTNSLNIGNLNEASEELYSYTIHEEGDNLQKTEVKVISEKGENSRIHIKKINNDNNARIEIIEEEVSTTPEKVYEIEIVEDNASEHKNTLTIKTDNKKIIKHYTTKKDNFLFMDSENGKPLYIIDGKVLPQKNINDINPDTIEKIEVLKGDAAIKKYGKKGENGVIIITSKKE